MGKNEKVIRVKDDFSLICFFCEMPLSSADEYHTEGFCVLYKAGIDPTKFIKDSYFDLRYKYEKDSE